LYKISQNASELAQVPRIYQLLLKIYVLLVLLQIEGVTPPANSTIKALQILVFTASTLLVLLYKRHQ
jgi:hypothetical protein